MIYDSLANIKNYTGLGRVSVALEFLANADLSQKPVGRYELDGDNIYYMIQEYTTKEGNIYSEAHKKYIDIQCVLDGTERIGIAFIADAGRAVEEKPENDYCLYECDTQPVDVKKNEFVVLYPSDVHLPGCAAGSPSAVRKVVVKVKI